MIRWIYTRLVVRGSTDRHDRRDDALTIAAGACPVCDHPFASLTHACLGTAVPTTVVGSIPLLVAEVA